MKKIINIILSKCFYHASQYGYVNLANNDCSYIYGQVNLKKKDGFKDYANKVP